MDCILANIGKLLLSFLGVIMVLWLCRTMSLFRMHAEVFKGEISTCLQLTFK